MRILLTAARAAALSALVLIPAAGAAPLALAQEAPPTSYSCDSQAESPMPATPMAGMDHGDMDMDEAMGREMDIDLMYIDMMIPHHESIIAMSEAALPLLTDERLREIAEAVMSTQQPEIDELQSSREEFYGEAMPMPMDDAMMETMHAMMPDIPGSMADMRTLMDTEALVAAFCAAENPDLAFIDLTLPHHQMAIEASLATVEQAKHPEIRDIAQRVIDAQQREIETLTAIREELAGAATPASS